MLGSEISGERSVRGLIRAAMAGGRWAALFRIGIGLVLGLVFAAIVIRHVDLRKGGAILEQASLAPILVALVAFASDFVLRNARFCGMLFAATGRPVPLARAFAPFVASFGMSDVLPLRAGDGLRVIWFSRRFDVPAGTVLGAILVERIFDLMALLLLGAIALPFASVAMPHTLVASFQFVLAGCLLIGLIAVATPTLLVRLCERLSTRMAGPMMTMLLRTLRAMADALRQIGSWRRMLLFGALSIACWLLESVVFLGAWLSLGGTGAAGIPFLSFIFSTLGTMVPSLPGHFGSYEYFGVQAFTLSGADPSFAAAVVFLAHLIIWAPTAIFGVLWVMIGAARTSPSGKPLDEAEHALAQR